MVIYNIIYIYDALYRTVAWSCEARELHRDSPVRVIFMSSIYVWKHTHTHPHTYTHVLLVD